MRSDGVFIAFIFIGIPWILGWIGKRRPSGPPGRSDEGGYELPGRGANSRLLDRFGAEPTFLEFLKSGGQRGLLDLNLH